jgi:hypothetical protein
MRFSHRASTARPLSCLMPAPRTRRLQETRIDLFLLSSPYVCPEPVLVERSFFIDKWLKKTVFTRRSSRVRRQPSQGSQPEKTVVVFEFSLCLSRACLGKKIEFIYKR